MDPIIETVYSDVVRYCHKKGYREGPGVNNFVPHDPVAAFAMARYLSSEVGFDHYVAIAPEGHIYGYFLEKLGCKTLEILVPYPPDRIEMPDDLTPLKGKRVLLIEDDVMSGATIRLATDALLRFKPKELSLYLGHSKGIQRMGNIPPAMAQTFIAEEVLDPGGYDACRLDFQAFFRQEAANGE